MKTVTLYRTKRTDGGIDVTPNKPNSDDYTETFRLIANDGKVLTDGVNYYNCVDTDNPDSFVEVDESPINSDEATTADLYEALAELGVE